LPAACGVYENRLYRKGRIRATVRTSDRPSLSAFAESRQVQDEAALVGFDWDGVEGPIEKILEEVGELSEALECAETERAEAELGDILLSVVNVARHMNADPEQALRVATRRFATRFNVMRATVERQGIELRRCSLEEMNDAWEKAKKAVANGHDVDSIEQC
jgi:tetrapyrrole methylase family protein/MazG family protein